MEIRDGLVVEALVDFDCRELHARASAIVDEALASAARGRMSHEQGEHDAALNRSRTC